MPGTSSSMSDFKWSGADTEPAPMCFLFIVLLLCRLQSCLLWMCVSIALSLPDRHRQYHAGASHVSHISPGLNRCDMMEGACVCGQQRSSAHPRTTYARKSKLWRAAQALPPGGWSFAGGSGGACQLEHTRH